MNTREKWKEIDELLLRGDFTKSMKPCSFCGGEAGIHEMSNGQVLYVECQNPDCPVDVSTAICKTPEVAVAIWNDRVTQ